MCFQTASSHPSCPCQWWSAADPRRSHCCTCWSAGGGVPAALCSVSPDCCPRCWPCPPPPASPLLPACCSCKKHSVAQMLCVQVHFPPPAPAGSLLTEDSSGPSCAPEKYKQPLKELPHEDSKYSTTYIKHRALNPIIRFQAGENKKNARIIIQLYLKFKGPVGKILQINLQTIFSPAKSICKRPVSR